ncbi:predicted protein [Nematostella vectensis]|uniref:Uncharacterized protein n=1 Tax=Nematostella vectensis TaxID=45351 RepID=A7SHW9_NEMVE|nr:predicted protein [Nematostella vectensis]|eukprot:XP_001628789.1 predicted protein [Nematostella vectensis]
MSQFCEQRGNWVAYYHWVSGYYFYTNVKTQVTQWEVPAYWNNLPPVYNPWSHSYPVSTPSEPTPDSASSTVGENNQTDQDEDEETNSFKITAEEIAKNLEKYKKRPAKRQADPDEKKKVHWIPEGATEYNIWYDRWVGEHWHKDTMGAEESETRCCLATDAGFTKATILEQSGNKHYYCIYFAKGCCHLGAECGFIHSIPTEKDVGRFGLAQDCFGRDRHQNHKENLGGVGAFDKESCTLYVGGLTLHTKLEEWLWEEFGEWGEIEDIRIIPKKNIAFVRYKSRLNAEFAKVAMADQRLGGRHLMNVAGQMMTQTPRPLLRI